MKKLVILFIVFWGMAAWADAGEPVIQCKIEKPDFAVLFTFNEDGSSDIKGKVLNETFSCQLQLQEIKDVRGGRSVGKFRILTHRADSKCNEKLSFDLKQGLNEFVDLSIHSDHAALYVFAGYKEVKCDQFKFSEQKLLAMTQKNLRKIDSIVKKRKSVPLKIKSIRNLKQGRK